jgi:hypothetical protein
MKRWEGDMKGAGIGDATRFLGGVHELEQAMSQKDWIAEDPQAHLLPHLMEACERPDSLLTLESTHVADDGTYIVTLGLREGDTSVGQQRAALFALLGEVSETATYVRQRRSDSGGLIFEVVTGIVDGQFAPHGHTLLIRLS